jgi:hypothetical protein
MRQQPRRCAPIRLGRVGQDFDVVHPRLPPRVLQRSKSWRKPSSMVRISAMKSKHIFARNVLPILVFGCAIFISTVAQGGAGYFRSNHHYAPGRLTVGRISNFGWNIGFNLQIDGRPAGSVTQGHGYSTLLPPGPHVLTVQKVPATGYTVPTSTTVNIQPGADYLYVAMWDSDLVYLHPVEVSVTAGAYWQLHGDGTP